MRNTVSKCTQRRKIILSVPVQQTSCSGGGISSEGNQARRMLFVEYFYEQCLDRQTLKCAREASASLYSPAAGLL